jgi:hypothetical protein
MQPREPLRSPGRRERGGTFMAYLGGTPARRMLQSADDEITKRYADDLVGVFPALRGWG